MFLVPSSSRAVDPYLQTLLLRVSLSRFGGKHQQRLTATNIINILPSKVVNFETPMERLLKEKPSYSSLRIFGCACWLNLRPFNSRKLAFRSIRCVFLGYSSLHKGFKCLEPSTGRVYISRDVVFDETVFPFASMHPNAGALLRKQISLHREHLHNLGVVDCHDPLSSNASNPGIVELSDIQEGEVQEDLEENSAQNRSNLDARLVFHM